MSGASIATTRSESTRGSRYAPSVSPFDPHHHHLSNLYKLHSPQDEFSFPRPENDEEIEMLFENIMRMRGLDDIPHLSIDQKWHIVYNDEQMRWGEERRREEQARRQTDSGQAAAFSEGTPEWYIKKFMDRTITPKQASSLQVSLRSKEMRSVSLSLSHMHYSPIINTQLVPPFRRDTGNLRSRPGSSEYQQEGSTEVRSHPTCRPESV